ncbi:MAG: roadblock/LC7 domain-containing protein [Candidatus Melainabacteria bacterium]|nr:roadblock/LC7 domain-containing protein [Candidatus Melainabacteria bacterium]
MFRMKFRSNIVGIGALVVGALLTGSMQFNPMFDGKEFLYDLPAMYVAPGIIAVPFLFALAHYRSCPAVQQFSAFLVTASFISLLGLVGNFTPEKMVLIKENWLLHFNVIQLSCINIAAIIAAMKIMAIEQMSSFADTKVAEAQLGRLKQAKVDPDVQAKWEKAASHAEKHTEGRSLRSTMTNLKAISLSDPSQELKPTVTGDKKAKEADLSAQEAGSLASLLDRIGEEPAPVAGEDLDMSPVKEAVAKEAETVEPQKAVAAPDEKEIVRSDDFVPPSGVDAPADSFLSKFLDREDEEEGEKETKADSKTETASSPPGANFRFTSQSTKSEPAPSQAVVSKPETPAAKVEASPAPAPAPAPPVEETQTPSSTVNRMQAMKRRNTSTFTKLQSLSASGSESLLPTKEETVEQEADSLKSLLDRLDEEKPVAKEEEAAPAAPVKQPLEAAYELTLDYLFQGDAAVKEKTEEVSEKAESKGRSSVSERLAQSEAPGMQALLDQKEAEKEAEKVAQEEAEQEAEAAKSPEEKASETGDEPVVEAPAEEAEEEESAPLFEGGVDSDIDNIFNTLAPPEAQREVDREATKGADTGEEEPAEDEEERSTLFEGGVDSDIDSIFSSLAPAEAQLEVKDLLKKPEPKEEVKAPEAVIEASKEEEPDSEEEERGALFAGGVDSDIDDIFSNLAPAEVQREVKDVLPAAKEKKAERPAINTESEAEGDGLFGESLGEDLDNIFSSLTETEQKEVSPETLSQVKQKDSTEKIDMTPPVKAEEKAPETAKEPVKEPAKEAAKEAPKEPAKEASKYKEVKEFGRLSGRSAAAPKTSGDSVGTMKTIGKLLLDVTAVENIIKAGETKKIGSGLSTAKVISAARGEGIRNILTTIDTYEGVAGSLIVGHDGLVIASTVGQGWDKDMLGALSTALLSTSNLATKKLEIGKLRQMVMLTKVNENDFRTTVLTDVEVGILAVFIEKTDLTKIDGLLESIHKTIHGG